MCFRVEHPLVGLVLVHLDLRLLREDEVEVLQRLREEEALHLVDEPAVHDRHIVQAGVPASRAGRRRDGLEPFPGEVLVLAVARHTVRVIQALRRLGPEDVVLGGGPEPGRGVGVLLARGRVGVEGAVDGELAVGPPEALGADLGGGPAVGLEVGLGERDAEVNVLLLVQEDAAEDEVSSCEARHCMCGKYRWKTTARGGGLTYNEKS